MYRALIICNSRFPEGRGALIDLHGPKKDGILLRESLTDHATGMFDKSEVRNLNEAESRECAAAVEEFFGAAEPDDTLLFYYSGHGRTRNQQLFLCAHDTNVDKLYSTAIPGGILKDIVASSLAQVKILILDCCYSAMFKGDEIADEFAGNGRYVIAATSATERASDGRRRGLPSPFTWALTEALNSRAEDRDGDGQVDLDDVYSYLDTVSFDGARPYRKFDGAGAVPIARRAVRQPQTSAMRDSSSRRKISGGLPTGDDAAIYALESAQADLPFLDRTVSGASFSQRRIDFFRTQMRSDLLENMPAKLSAEEFLHQAGLIRHDRLTYAGLLLFGENPTSYLPAAIVQCIRFHGTTMTAPLESTDIHGSVPELIVKARDFIAALARTGELPTADGAYAEMAYRYPMIAVRELIANAVVHRDYSDQQSCVQVRAFDDRIEVISPGRWGGAPIPESGERPIGQLERRSEKRNFRLAQTMTWSKLVEGVGAGVPRSIADCESTGAPEPVVLTDDRMVQVTIFPSPTLSTKPPGWNERERDRLGRAAAKWSDGRIRPYFFLSYARTPKRDPAGNENPDRWVQKLYVDLCDEILQLTDSVPEEVGFMDLYDKPGSDWSANLTAALAACKVFVPLYSRRYFESDQCGREWFAFARREVTDRARRGDRVDAIVPALWTRLDRDKIPAVAQSIQYDYPDLGDRYHEDGFYGLIKLKNYRADYQRAVHRLAERIVTIGNESDRALDRTDLRQGYRLDFESLQSAFGPAHVGRMVSIGLRIVVLAPSVSALPPGRNADFYGATPRAWAPYLPEYQQPLANYATELARKSQGIDPLFVGTISEITESPSCPTLVLVDPWAAAVPEYAEQLLILNDIREPWVSVMIPWNESDWQLSTARDNLREKLEHHLGNKLRTVPMHCRMAADGIPSLDYFGQIMPKMTEIVLKRFYEDSRT